MTLESAVGTVLCQLSAPLCAAEGNFVMGVYLVTIIAILAAAIGEAVGHRFAWAALWAATC